MFLSGYSNLVIKSELEGSPAHSPVWAGTQPPPLGTPLSVAGHCSQTSEHWCEQFMSDTASEEWALSPTWAFLLLGTPTPVLISHRRVKYKQPKWSQAWSHPALGVSRRVQEQEPAQLQRPALVSAGWPWDCLSWITMCVHGQCAPVSFSATKQQPEEARLNEHQRHIYHHSADGKHLPGHRLPFLPSLK